MQYLTILYIHVLPKLRTQYTQTHANGNFYKAFHYHLQITGDPRNLCITNYIFMFYVFTKSHRSLFTWPSLPGCFSIIPPLDTALATLPQLSTHTAPTVSWRTSSPVPFSVTYSSSIASTVDSYSLQKKCAFWSEFF